MVLKRFLPAIFASMLLTGSARAQDSYEIAPPSINTPLLNPFQLPIDGEGSGNPSNAVDLGTSVKLAALLSETSPILTRDVIWRVYSERADEQQGLSLVTQTNEAQPQLRLPPGNYVINAAFGRATVTRRLQIGNVPINDRFILNAGGLVLAGAVEKQNIPSTRLWASIFTGPGPGGQLVLESARAGQIIRLPEGDYYIISHYGDANAVLAADITVKPGMVTEATMNHRAAQVVLKLVNESGGEAIANTTWSVLTPGGDPVKEVIGAFPSVVLQQGEYKAVARNEGRNFDTTFKVEPGKDQEIEVLTQ